MGQIILIKMEKVFLLLHPREIKKTMNILIHQELI